jgi:nicotinate-nucleotide adenylyltransferase
MRVGLLGGTFDPIHVGHLDVARAACAALRLDRVLLLPARVPPHRDQPHASPWHRFAMTSMAAQELDHASVSDVDMLSDGPSYTASSLDRLAARGLDTRTLFFITGADAFRDIRSWKDYPAILDRCQFVVVSRPGCPAVSMRDVLPELAKRMQSAVESPGNPSIFLVDAVTAPVSSTDVRARLSRGDSVRGLVTPAVETHIVRHGLYGSASSKGLA